MKLSIDVNVNLNADAGLVRLLRELLGAKPTTVAAAPTHLPRIDPEPEPKHEPTLKPHDVARMLTGPTPEPTPIPEAIRRTTLHPVTQEALAALRDPIVTGRAIDAVASRDRAHVGPVPVEALTPDALAKPRTIAAPAKAPEDPQLRPSGYLTVAEATAAYGVHFTTLYDRVKKGKLHKVNVGRTAYFAPPAA